MQVVHYYGTSKNASHWTGVLLSTGLGKCYLLFDLAVARRFQMSGQARLATDRPYIVGKGRACVLVLVLKEFLNCTAEP